MTVLSDHGGNLEMTGGHVVLVEDSSLLGEAFRLMLEHSGFRVSLADSLASAMRIEEPADVLLLDVTLPDGDGISLLERLRADSRDPRFSIALTGHDDAATRQRCLKAGCAQVLVKPVAPSELVRKVRELLLEGHRPLREE